jgi:hypothetical protein
LECSYNFEDNEVAGIVVLNDESIDKSNPDESISAKKMQNSLKIRNGQLSFRRGQNYHMLLQEDLIVESTRRVNHGHDCHNAGDTYESKIIHDHEHGNTGITFENLDFISNKMSPKDQENLEREENILA